MVANKQRIPLSLTLGLLTLLGVLALLGEMGGPSSVVHADPGTLYVAPDGSDAKSCNSPANRCRTVQRAVNVAAPGDEILVATGVYTPNGQPQVVSIDEGVIIRGGYSGDFAAWDPEAYPTTLDAQKQGRVVYITGYIAPTLEGLRITGGYVSGQDGGGLYIASATATISGCRIYSNTARYGGGVYLYRNPSVLNANAITTNTATAGGGLYQDWGGAVLTKNVIADNQASTQGGGLYLRWCVPVLSNNVIADNTASTDGGGLYAEGTESEMRHNTIACNGGNDGIHVTKYYAYGLDRYSVVTLTNTILASHTVGLNVTAGNAVIVDGVLWHQNGANTVGAGDFTVTQALTDTPAFAADGYHITAGSAAADNGVDSGLSDDIDGDPRPQGSGYDLGADEIPAPMIKLSKRASAPILGLGQVVTYTLVVTSTGQATAPAVHLTDALPPQQQAQTASSDRGACSVVPGWGGGAACDLGDLPPGAAAHVTLVAQVTTTLPFGNLPLAMRNAMTATTGGVARSAYTDTHLVHCRARLNDVPAEYLTVQAAADAASAGDTVKISGLCQGVEERYGLPQTAYIDKALTLLGGWSADFATRDRALYPTTLDAQEQGRVLYIDEQATGTTIGGLHLINGDAQGLGGVQPYDPDAGGGVYVFSATVVISGCHVSHSTAQKGGGVFLVGGDSFLIDNVVSGNMAQGQYGQGGGLYLWSDSSTLVGNTVVSNTAQWGGGGAHLSFSEATLQNNAILSNTADHGGGLSLTSSTAVISGNTVAGNVGSGIDLAFSSATLEGNTISGNSNRGLYLDHSPAAIGGNTISGNAGAGLYLDSSTATIERNVVTANVNPYQGGGLYLRASDAFLVNNVFADNQAVTGSGLYIRGSSPRLLHNTIVHNRAPDGSSDGVADGVGVYVTNDFSDDSTAWLTNTILVSHTVGISVTAGNTALLEGVLWHQNGAGDSGGPGAITVTGGLSGDPAFAADGYHITAASAAADSGVESGLPDDIDGDLRPQNDGYDLGADERPGARLDVAKQADRRYVNPGQTVTYTVVITSEGIIAATGVHLTDTLPPQQYPLAANTDLGICTLVTGWGGGATCNLGDMAPGTTAHVTLSAQATTSLPAHLPLAMRNRADVSSAETSRWAQADTILQNCHARLGSTDYDAVQKAVDAAGNGDLVKVAGVCLGAEERNGARQQVYLDKSLTIRGGYTPGFADPPDPDATPTTLNALGEGRVIAVIGDVAPALEGLHVTGGASAASGGGGGVYVLSATMTISGCTITTNTAEYGGGIAVRSSAATLTGNTITANSADYGGGVYLGFSDGATLSSNDIAANTATYGGGLLVDTSSATLDGNDVVSNTAIAEGGGMLLYKSDAVIRANAMLSNTARERGGGLYLDYSPGAVLDGNDVVANAAAGEGGGLYLDRSGANLECNEIVSNTAGSLGGGLYLSYSNDATLSDNAIVRNAAAQRGGGLYLYYSDATLDENIVISNTTGGDGGGLYLRYSDAAFSKNDISANTAGWSGGGAYLYNSDASSSGDTFIGNAAGGSDAWQGGGGLYLSASAATLVNAVVIDNQAAGAGSGMHVRDSSPRLWHATIARNGGGDGSGAHVIGGSTAWLTNTILADHTVGITATAGNAVTVNGVLWHGNAAKSGGTGAITVNNDRDGDPAFAAAGAEAAHPYHLTAASDAIDGGVSAGVTSDIDGQMRPQGAAPDLGADEFALPGTPTAVTLSGPITGLVGSACTFTATVDPLTATLPITYTWQATGQATQVHTVDGRSDTLQFTWTVTGTQEIVVTATNAVGGAASTPHAIAIEVKSEDQWQIYLPLVLRD